MRTHLLFLRYISIFLFIQIVYLAFFNKTTNAQCSTTPIASPNTICAGSSSYLNANVSPAGSYTYSWTPTGTLDDPTSATPLATPTVTTTYTVVITPIPSGTPCNGSVTVTVNQLPTSVATSPDASRCGTGTVTLTATGASTGESYRWYSASTGGSLLGTGSSFTTPSISTTTTYYVTTYNTTTGCEHSTRTAVTATVNPLPTTPTIVSGPTTVCAGTAGNVYVTQAGYLNYLWTVSGGGNITAGGGTGSNSVTVTWNTTGAQTVSVNYSNSFLCYALTPAVYNVTVNQVPTADFTFATTACSGQTVSFSNNSTGSGLTYQWNFGDPGSGLNNTSTQTNPSHIYTLPIGCNSGSTFNITLITTNTFGCQNTIIKSIVINTLPNPQLADQNIFSPFNNCSNHPSPSNPDYSLTVLNTTTNTGCISSYTILWGDGTNTTFPPNSFPYTHTYTSLGVFTLTFIAYSNSGCSGSSTNTIINQSIQAIGIYSGGGTSGCAPSTFPFTLLGPANNPPGTNYYIWDGDGVSSIIPSILADTVIHLTYNTTSCGKGLNGNEFTLRITAKNSCPDTASNTYSPIYIFTKPTSSFTATPFPVACVNQLITFTNTSLSGYGSGCNTTTQVTWDFGDGSPTTNVSNPTHTYILPNNYQVSLTVTNGQCSDDTIRSITINPRANPTITGSQNVCAGTTGVVYTTQSGMTGYTWTISSGGTITAGSGTNSITVTWTTAGAQTVSVNYSLNGCPALFATVYNITVNPLPTPTILGNSTVCVGSSGNTYTTQPGKSGYTWSVSSGGTITAGTGTNSITVTWNSVGSQTVSVNYTDGNGCIAQSPFIFNVTVYSLPVPTITGTTTVCVGATGISYTTESGMTGYNWAVSGGGTITGGSTTNTITVNWNTSGSQTVSVNYIDSHGCTAVSAKTITVTVLADPVVSVQPLASQTVCQNSVPTTLSVSFTGGTGTASFQWYSNTVNSTTGGTIISGATSSTYVPSTLTVGTMYYYCVITQTGPGCGVTSSTAAVIVTTAPTFTAQPSPSTVCVGGTATLLTVAYINGAGAPSYQWYSNTVNNNITGTIITGATSSSYQPPSIIAGNTYYYCVISFATGGCSNITSNTALVTIQPDPTINTEPMPAQSLCIGGSLPAALNVGYTGGTGTATYQWYSNSTPSTTGGTPISGATSQTYMPPVYTTAGNYYYYAIVSLSGNGCGTATSTLATVTVVANPIVNNQPLVSQTVCQNAIPTTLSVTVGGGVGTPSYQWYSNTVNSTTGGTLISGATTNSYVPPTSNVGTKYYYCIITQSGPGCSVTSNTATVIVNTGPTFTTQPSPSTVCVGGAPTVLNVTYTNGAGTPSYQWYSNTVNNNTTGTIITGATSASYLPPSTIAGMTYYYCIISFITGGCSNINSNTALVTIQPDPTISTQPMPAQSLCIGGSLPSALNVNYTGGTGTASYQWNSNTSPSTTGGTPISGATSSTYMPPAYGTAGTFYYYVVVSLSGDGCGSVTSNLVTVTVVATPNLSNQPLVSQTLCQNAVPTTLSVTVSGGVGTSSYQWYSNTVNSTTGGTLISGATNNSYVPPTTIVGTKYYYCVITQLGPGCTVTSNTAMVIVNTGPTFTTQPLPSTVCVGGTPALLNVTYINGAGTPSYQWYSNIVNNNMTGTIIPGATSASYQPPSILAGTTYYYCIISFATGGCSNINSNTALVTVQPDPTISTQPMPAQSLCVGGTLPAALSVSYTGGTGTASYQWYSNTTASTTGGTPISGATSQTYMPPAYVTAGNYYYYVIVSLSGDGCGSTTSNLATVTVVVNPIVSLQPLVSQTLCQNAIPTALSVTVTGGVGISSYQWYSNTVNSTTGGTLISGATNNSYVPPTSIVGTKYYYCVITQSGAGCGVTSNTATVIVNTGPTFTTQPSPSTVCVGGTPTLLNVAYTNGAGTPSYQWYSNTINNNTTGIIIPSATNSSYQPPSLLAGTTYYYCIISFATGGVQISIQTQLWLPFNPIRQSAPSLCLRKAFALEAPYRPH